MRLGSTGDSAGPQSDGKKAPTLKRQSKEVRVPAFTFSFLRKLLTKKDNDGMKGRFGKSKFELGNPNSALLDAPPFQDTEQVSVRRGRKSCI